MQINAAMPDIGAIVKKHLPDLQPFEETYRDIHRHPELGGHEERTANIAATHLEGLGYEVTRGIGGHGVTGVLRNGAGKTLLLRADMDGLPVEERTGLPYASTDRGPNGDGDMVPVMHACGHDMHVASLMAAAAVLVRARADWRGTLICLFQPNEEGGGGARAMFEDGLYDKVPVPDLALAQHVFFGRAGSFAAGYGTVMSAADSFHVTVWGRSGHGSMPQVCVDPVLIASYIVVRLQSIVSRMVAAADRAVITVGSLHAGDADNVIPGKAELSINVRSYKPEVRQRIHQAIKDIVLAECRSAGAPKDPDIELVSHLPATTNDDHTIRAVLDALSAHFGEANVQVIDGVPASEDVSELTTPHNIPLAYWNFGGTDHQTWDDAVKRGDVDSLPQNHNARFAPTIEPTLSSGVQAMALAALRFLV